MPPRIPLPDEFSRAPFSVGEAARRGLARGRLSGPDLQAPFRGVREVAAGAAELRIDEFDDAVALRRCRAFAPLLRPRQFFGFISAAHIWNCPIRADEDRHIVHVCSTAPASAPRRRSVVGHQVRADLARVVVRNGLRVADPGLTFLQLAGVVSLEELIVAGDHLVHDPPVLDPYDLRPHVTASALRIRVAGWSGRGRGRADEALHLLRDRSESRMETLLRLLLRRAGFPDPDVNPTLSGIRRRWHHRADLVYHARRVIVEYDGDQHRTDTRQYNHDMRRFDDFVEDGWRLVRVRKQGVLVDPAETVDRVRVALAVGGTLPQP